MYTSIGDFLKKEAVMIIAIAAAVISCTLVPVTNYIEYIDTDMIGILFGLMAVVAGFEENNVFRRLSEIICKTVGNTRKLAFLLVFSVFLLSMLVTNDVALITFVPFTLMLYQKLDRSPVGIVVLQTIAANLGSALTPIGNPQNLYLFTQSKMSGGEFFSLTLTITGVSLILLLIAMFFIKSEPVMSEDTNDGDTQITNPRYLILYATLFLLCILAVFGVVDTIMVFASVCVVFAIVQPVIFSKVDYGLLVTFACFFIFVGNIKNVPAVHDYISQLISGREFESAVVCSQIISNVPTAVMLSAFTDNFRALILGTNVGGLGTLVASLASLISYKLYICSDNSSPKKYISFFTILNIIFLIIIFCFAKFVVLHT
ncbi:MAG: SLC13 family permease [Huintestinicola sp.]